MTVAHGPIGSPVKPEKFMSARALNLDGTVKSQNNGDFPKSPLIKSAT
jgi:hypothetical protein